jgi:hypothetical protein
MLAELIIGTLDLRPTLEGGFFTSVLGAVSKGTSDESYSQFSPVNFSFS